MGWLEDRLVELMDLGFYYRQWREAGDMICMAVNRWPEYAPPLGPKIAAYPARKRGRRQFLGRWIRGKVEADIDRMLDIATGLSVALTAHGLVRLTDLLVRDVEHQTEA